MYIVGEIKINRRERDINDLEGFFFFLITYIKEEIIFLF